MVRVVRRSMVVLLPFSMPLFSTSIGETLFFLSSVDKVHVGDGGICIPREVGMGIQLHSCYFIWGSNYKMVGPACNFDFFWGPLCGVVSLLLI